MLIVCDMGILSVNIDDVMEFSTHFAGLGMYVGVQKKIFASEVLVFCLCLWFCYCFCMVFLGLFLRVLGALLCCLA
jgi:hypothetical protein